MNLEAYLPQSIFYSSYLKRGYFPHMCHAIEYSKVFAPPNGGIFL